MGQEGGAAEPDRRRGRGQPISARRAPTTSPTGRSSPSSSARRSRSPSTSWATSTSPRAATSSATPTTRSSRRQAELSPLGAAPSASRRERACGALLREPLLHFLLARRCCCSRPTHGCIRESLARDASQPHRADAGRSAPDRASAGSRRAARRRRRRRCAASSRAGSARRSSTARRWRSASTRTTRSSSAAWRRRWSSSSEDVAALREPTAEELKAWFAKNAARFALPARVDVPASLLLARPARRARARRTRRTRSRKLAGKPGDSPARGGARRSLHVPGLLRRSHARQTSPRTFGPPFAEALVVQLTPGAWPGPIESGYGWHLVFVDSLTPARAPAFEEVEPDVKTAWLADAARGAGSKALRGRCGRSYELVAARGPGVRADRAGRRAGDAARGETRRVPRDACSRSRCSCALSPRARREAHESRPAYLEIRETAPGRYDRAVAHAGPLRHAPARRAEAPRRRARTSREPTVQELTDSLVERRDDRRGAGRARRQAHRVRGPPGDDHGRAGARRARSTAAKSTTLVRPSQPWVEIAAAQRHARGAAAPTSCTGSSTSSSASTICSSCWR